MRNVSLSLGHLTSWSSVGGAICGDLDVANLLKKVSHWGQAERLKSLACFHFVLSLLLLVVQEVRAQLPTTSFVLAACCYAVPTITNYPSTPVSQNNVCSSVTCPGHGILHKNIKITNKTPIQLKGQ